MKTRCRTCVMDTSDPQIIFYDDGTCSHCRHAMKFSTYNRETYELRKVVEFIKEFRSKNSSEYDCIIGLSGGVDSSWLLHLLNSTGLRIYVHHVDTGWNTGPAVSNIFNLCSSLNLDLRTHVVDWNLMRELQTAFFYSGVINQDIPQDIAIFSSQLATCINHEIPIVASGANNTTESILPSAWGHHWHDIVNLSSIYGSFWNKPLSSFPYCSLEDITAYRWGHNSLKCKPINILDIVAYKKKAALDYLVANYSYRPYEQKHGESAWTLYYQAIYLPQVYNVDKRTAHLSNLIVNGDISRSDAVAILSQPTLNQEDSLELVNLISLKLKIPYEHALNPSRYIKPNSHLSFSNLVNSINHYTRIYSSCKSNPERDIIFNQYLKHIAAKP